MTLKKRVDKLQAEHEARVVATVDGLVRQLPDEERAALIAALDADLGNTPPVDAETDALADAAHARLWEMAGPAERCLLQYGATPAELERAGWTD